MFLKARKLPLTEKKNRFKFNLSKPLVWATEGGKFVITGHRLSNPDAVEISEIHPAFSERLITKDSYTYRPFIKL